MQSAVQGYVDLCKYLCIASSDYGNKQKLKAHNRAMGLLRDYADELAQDPERERIFAELLGHSDVVVSVTAAADCIRFQIHKEKAVAVLKEAVKHENPVISLDTKMLLKSV